MRTPSDEAVGFECQAENTAGEEAGRGSALRLDGEREPGKENFRFGVARFMVGPNYRRGKEKV
jgi:hypothetical protein